MIVRSRNSLTRLAALACVAAALALLSGLGRAVANEMSNQDTIAVSVDQAKLVKLPARVATLVVGNPLIADVTLQSGGLVVVTGKGYGATNVIALDRAGEVLIDRTIVVSGPTDKVVTIYRGAERESYSCEPNCERRVTLGDSEKFFKSTMDQAGTLSREAAGGGTVGKAN
ncbi:MAG: pilus assembly protein N-terminal domain-containing protein [Xanthobacteraceae bacterium]|nr:pilus assembly protein N-terminal domain-containing protein [Xanthobacteraceae bacterium]